MDAELSLLTANLALAAPGKLFYDPFVGTGSFPLAAAHWGAVVWGSDIDGRAVRGATAGINGNGGSGGSRHGRRDVRGNFEQYALLPNLADLFTADLTNSPVRRQHGPRWLDGIVCDPPYGVREGPRVLGVRNPTKTPWVVEAGRRRFRDPTFVPPKQPYGFTAMLSDLLQFAADTLVDDGRLAFWMPTANDAAQELPLPTNPHLALVSLCVQPFNKWSRRLITYRRLPDHQVDPAAVAAARAQRETVRAVGGTANELNSFRRGYFTKFAAHSTANEPAEIETVAVKPAGADSALAEEKTEAKARAKAKAEALAEADTEADDDAETDAEATRTTISAPDQRTFQTNTT